MNGKQKRTVRALACLLVAVMLGGLGGAAAGETHSHQPFISGYPDDGTGTGGTFRPDDNLTRAEAAVVLEKFAWTVPDAFYLAVVRDDFYDVGPEDWFYSAVINLGGWQVIDGYADGGFHPEQDVTRAEFLAMLLRLYDVGAETAEISFSDVPDSHWASAYIARAVHYGVADGLEDGTFAPDRPITRAEAVTMVNRARGCEGITEGVRFTDVPEDHWAFAMITAAATEHEHTEG